jgi:hypothetical protein
MMQRPFQRLAQDSISSEKDLLPFWSVYCNEISNVLWLPTQTDSLDLDLSLSNGSAHTQNVNSWFSMTQSYPQIKNLYKIWLSIIHCFSDRLYGLRKYKKQINQELQEKQKTSSRQDKAVTQQCLENQGVPTKGTL